MSNWYNDFVGLSPVQNSSPVPFSLSSPTTNFSAITPQATVGFSDMSTSVTNNNATQMASLYDLSYTPFKDTSSFDKVSSKDAKMPNTTVGGNAGGDSSTELRWYQNKDVIKSLGKSVAYIMQGVGDVMNGYIDYYNSKMKASNSEFQAYENRRTAELLEKNMRDITMAAQRDANVYKMQRKETNNAQIAAMSQSGFAVGKGVYANTLAKTDAYTAYNVSAIMLKSELQNAEVVRKAGTYKAQAIINDAEAEIYKKQAKTSRTNGWIKGTADIMAAGGYAYAGGVNAGWWGKSEGGNE